LPNSNSGVVVAVSGGADSTALLLALDELVKSKKLNLKIIVAHLDHGLRQNASKADARWMKALAKRLGYEILVKRVDVRTLAAQTGDNLEQAARRARYEFLANIARKKRADIVLTAHTMDDQAETVLLNLLRGSGANGLGGIERSRPLGEQSKIVLARPLLSWARRRDTESYCGARDVRFRVDEMNADERFARVRVRRQLLPLMESFNPKMVECLARTAELLREDSVPLDRAAALLLELSSEDEPAQRTSSKTGPRLRLDLLASAEPALRRRALRRWISRCRGNLRRVERVHILAVESLVFGDRGGRVVELPGGSKISRTRGLLCFCD
jgi:tRNA(Ile)-lysidine synthase